MHAFIKTLFIIALIFTSSCSHLGPKKSRSLASIRSFVNQCVTSVNGIINEQQYSDKVEGAFKLRLKTDDGSQIIEQVAANFVLARDGRAHPHARRFAFEYFSRSPEQIASLNKTMTDIHASNEMTFMTKDSVTGQYTKVNRVPFRGFVPMPKSSYQKLTGSTEAFMKTFREILQYVYSKEHNAENLTLTSLPSDLQELFLDVLKSNIYYEPELNKPVMKDYPFSAVVGFDFAIDDILNPKPISYEANGSTPSGLSNNLLLKHALQQGDKELFDEISKGMQNGNPFKALKETIDSNALRWTGDSNGISVVIGPGSGNGAHPDVAAIADFSGMPLVDPKDLYIDETGAVRLNTGNANNNPKVTGVYSRTDESFLLQSTQRNIPIRDPAFYEEINKKMTEKYDISLEPHIGYSYIYNNRNEVIGLNFNPDGSPKLLESFYKIGKDPTRPQSQQTDDLVDALLSRNIYISNVGGRTLDDKRIFQIIADRLANRYLPEGADGVGPTRTLGQEELQELYDMPIDQLGKFVIKEPDGSGGKGVYILANEPNSVRREIVEKVKANPTYYTIQEFADQSVVITSGVDEAGNVILETTAMDARYYAFLDGDNKLIIDPDAFLVRVASPLSGSTNTSKGAGYGLFYVVDDSNRLRTNSTSGSVLPPRPSVNHIGFSRKQNVEIYAKQINYLIDSLSQNQSLETLKPAVDYLIFLHRESLDLFGVKHSFNIQIYRKYVDGQLTAAEFKRLLVMLKESLKNDSELPTEVSNIFRSSL